MSDEQKAAVLGVGLCAMQVCVPAAWTDDEVASFANRESPTGISSRWAVRKQADWDKGVAEGWAKPADATERVACEGREGFVHVVLDC